MGWNGWACSAEREFEDVARQRFARGEGAGSHLDDGNGPQRAAHAPRLHAGPCFTPRPSRRPNRRSRSNFMSQVCPLAVRALTSMAASGLETTSMRAAWSPCARSDGRNRLVVSNRAPRSLRLRRRVSAAAVSRKRGRRGRRWFKNRSSASFRTPERATALVAAGHVGGMHWGGMAWDPMTRTIIAAVNRIPAIVRSVPSDSSCFSIRSPMCGATLGRTRRCSRGHGLHRMADDAQGARLHPQALGPAADRVAESRRGGSHDHGTRVHGFDHRSVYSGVRSERRPGGVGVSIADKRARRRSSSPPRAGAT